MVDAKDADLEESGLGSALAVILVAGAAASLVIFPAAIALHAPGVPSGWAAGAVGIVAAVIGIGKLAAMAWGAGSQMWGSHRASVDAAYAD